YLRPSFEFKSFEVATPTVGTLAYRANSFELSIGVVYNLPELPRSPIKSDRIQMKHVITSPKSGAKMEVRGQPFYKKQNPNYGELNPYLHRQRWGNRNKREGGY
ncbi:MAG: hypothetical protein HC842_06105, partial [Cytophagales bacterium]|nr:hypothetical protein [Cytophagales bacterium]